MTPKRERFCEEYLVDLNATQAAIRAGYAESGASVEGCRLLADPKIQERITKARAELRKGTLLDVQGIMERIQDNADRSKKKGADGNELKGLELLGKHHAAFRDRVEHSGPNGAPLKIEVEWEDGEGADEET